MLPTLPMYLHLHFCQDTTEITEVAGVSEVAETLGITVNSSEAIAEWRRVCQEQDEEYEKSLQLDQEKVVV